MGFNFTIAALADTRLEDLAGLGIRTTGATTSGDLALEEGAPYVGVRDGQLVFACASPELLDEVQQVSRELDARAVVAVFGSTADVHVLWMRDGEREHERVLNAGDVMDSLGEPWPEEEAAFAQEQFESDAVAETFARLTGVQVLDEQWLAGTFHELDWPFSSDSDPHEGEHTGAAGPVDQDFIEVDRGLLQGLAALQRAGLAVMVLLGLGVLAEIGFLVLAVTRDESFGVPLPHLVFGVLALMTVLLGRLDAGRLMWTAASAGVLLFSIVVTGIARDHHVAVLSAYAVYLAVVIGALLWHAQRVKAVRRQLPR
ncbi:hypothetical protein [Nocardioides sp. Soil796]|uniref:hypothetical protein n=1 Tax=Nocardioides sp. Soil796 TaxID=1736412 RepID=UPI000709A7C7|nr:hypothetical protein [Nocardioides sp. Soil796]KRF14175.1 hypothetical protein ASH02_07400 [Nocardioides sp. Soil796]